MARTDSSAEFLRRAAAEAARYGEDPYVFLRELGQNARDADAGRIQVQLRLDGGRARLIFSDDGRGMSLEHARAYLFRLYASSKEAEVSSAGRFGVGFWSVLRWNPDRIEVHSRSQDQAWGVGLSGDLNAWERMSCQRKKMGTSVVLDRRLDGISLERLRSEVHQGLVRYLAHLRTTGIRARPLPVRFEGRSIERPFGLQGPGALQFREGPLEGVVGFGPQPSYRLFARGLPVMEGSFLDELEGSRRKNPQKPEREGVAPVYLLNGNNLEVVLSRQTVLRDHALKELLRVARARFEELVARTIDGAVPLSFGQRMSSLVARLARSFGRAPAWLRIAGLVAALLLVGGAIGLGTAWLSRSGLGDRAGVVTRPGGDKVDPVRATRAAPQAIASRNTPRAVRMAVHRQGDWAGVRTGTVVADAADSRWDLAYEPGIDLMFRRSLLTRFDRDLGFQAALEQGPWKPAGRGPLGPANGVEIQLRLDDSGGRYILPVPTGFVPVGRGHLAGHPRRPIEVNPLGLARIEIPPGVGGILRYRVVPAGTPLVALVSHMSEPTSTPLPAGLLERLDELASWPMDERIAGTTRLVQELLRYDRSAQTAAAFEQRIGQGRDWASAVLDIGAGDCDVINGLAVLFLRRMGIPARLVAGMVGRAGQVQDGWHAWIEIVQEDRLVVLDVSLGAPVLRPPSQGGTLVASGTAVAGPQGARPPVGTRSSEVSPPAWIGRLQSTGLVLLWFALAMVVLFALYALKRRGQLAVTSDEDQRRELLAGMAADALRRPQAWKDVQGIWHRGILPCIGGRAISLARLVRLSRAERAFVGRSGGQLVSEAVRSGLVVLAADDPHFGPLYSRTANLRDLDELERNRPLPSPKGVTGPLLEALEGMLVENGCRVACRGVRPDGSGRPFWDVDLSPIKPRRRSGWPKRFVAVDIAHPWWRATEQLYRQAPRLAVCVATERLAASSGMLTDRAGKVRRTAALRALERSEAKG